MAKTARPTFPNAGVEAKFNKALQELCQEFEQSVFYWTKAAYNKSAPRVETLIAQDASIVTELNKVFKELGKRWIKKFEDAAPIIAEKYTREQFKASDSAFMRSLIDAGFAVTFKPTPTIKEAMRATLAESITLIKSIPEKHLKDIEGLAMRSVVNGRDMQTFVGELKDKYGATQKQATLIARNQSNRVTASVRQIRCIESGLTEAIWLHAHGGRFPRASHVAADKKTFSIAEGMEIDGVYIMPGELINCRCSFKPILPKL